MNEQEKPKSSCSKCGLHIFKCKCEQDVEGRKIQLKGLMIISEWIKIRRKRQRDEYY